jgi:hypothetical protein
MTAERKATAAILIAGVSLFVSLGGYAIPASPQTSKIKNNSITASQLSPSLRKLIAKHGAQGPPGARGPQGLAGPQGPAGAAGAAGTTGASGAAAGQLLDSTGGLASFINTTVCSRTPLAKSTFTLSSPSFVMVSFSSGWNQLGNTGRVDARVTLTDAGGQTVATGGPDVDFSPPRSFGQSNWTGFLSSSSSGGAAALIPAGTYTLTMTPIELLITCETTGQWSSVQMTSVAVRAAG